MPRTLQSNETFALTLPTNATVVDGVVTADLTGAGAPGTTAQDVYWSASASRAYDADQGNVCLVDATAAPVSLTLPAGSDDILGIRYSLIKTDAVANAVQFARAGSDTIEGVTALAISTQNSRLDLAWAGDMWRRCSPTISTSNFLTTYGNLVGVASPKLSRQAIGANEHLLVGQLTSVVGATAEVLCIPWPYTVAYGNAYVIDFMAVLNGTTDNDVILTLAINGAAATPTLTIPAGVAGARVQATLTLGNALTALGYISIAVSGTNTLAVGATVTVKCII